MKVMIVPLWLVHHFPFLTLMNAHGLRTHLYSDTSEEVFFINVTPDSYLLDF